MSIYSTTATARLIDQIDELRDLVIHADVLGIQVIDTIWSAKGFTITLDKEFAENQRAHLKLKDELAILGP